MSASKHTSDGRKTLPLETRMQIVAKAAGRCSFRGCNQLVIEHNLTGDQGNYGAFAHIIAASPNGPRGDHELSAKLATDENNIMLLCPDCHKLIDDHPEDYPVEMLREMKREHEERIARLTAISAARRTRLLLVHSRIGDRLPLLTEEAAKVAVTTGKNPRYPIQKATTIPLSHLAAVKDHDPTYWRERWTEMEHDLDRFLEDLHRSSLVDHVSLFAIAPIPLLVATGYKLGDLCDVDVFMLSRDPKGWSWPDDVYYDLVDAVTRDPTCCTWSNDTRGPLDIASVSEPAEELTAAEKVALLVSMTGPAVRPPPDQFPAVYEIKLSRPRVDSLRSREHLGQFRRVYRETITRITERFGRRTPIHLFPAVPNAAAVEMGRSLLPKADPPIIVWDFNQKNDGKHNGWREALQILE